MFRKTIGLLSRCSQKEVSLEIFENGYLNGSGELSAREDMEIKYGEVMLIVFNMDIPELCLIRALSYGQTNVHYLGTEGFPKALLATL